MSKSAPFLIYITGQMYTLLAMSTVLHKPISFLVLATPHFNLATTTAFLDPFRAANYLTGENRFKWVLTSKSGGEIPASNGMLVTTVPISDHLQSKPDIVVVSSSWAPESHHNFEMTEALIRWVRSGSRVVALDTGGFILAKSGLLDGKRATVHYEHIDAFIELFPDVTVTEDLFVDEGNVTTCSGGLASVDLALNILGEFSDEGVANATARYLFHHKVRSGETSQNPNNLEPFGRTTPKMVRCAIDLMEANLENPLSIPAICTRLQISQRHLGRLFNTYVQKTPVQYYRDIRLDRARGLVTQTEMKLSEIAVASGFASQVHFSRAYHERFGLQPKQDRIEGRVPFEFRAWPMHNPKND